MINRSQGLCGCADQFDGSSITGPILVEANGNFTYTFPTTCGESTLTLGAMDLTIGAGDQVTVPREIEINADAQQFTLRGLDANSKFNIYSFRYQNEPGNLTNNFTDGQAQIRNAASALPVTLYYWGAAPTAEAVSLTWASIEETDNDFYAVEYSRDGRSFTEVGRVEGKGSFTGLSHYSFTHVPDGGGTHFYRLTQYDYDGTKESFAVRSVAFGEERVSGLYPNPASAGQRLTFDANNGAREATLVHIDGRIAATLAIGENGKSQSLDLPANLPAGIYALRVGSTTSRIVVR
ncbi:T9SS type A sorting domain-containing protein [Lewinella sp. IMCC34183]|uniref:T9SS type A sorting domain-containing protein n=1 Tax=Lewinella sp. IMCC34183 TaxID=2248762 RepID=UPI00130021E1|nr:T9SS type A sorting domain-containing protein [Lewinella sp. IMCC34183]